MINTETKIEACSHQRILQVSAKSVDCCFVRWPNGEVSNGYAPTVPGLCHGDYIEVDVCIDCGRLVGFPAGQDDVILAEQPDKIDGFEPRINGSML